MKITIKSNDSGMGFYGDGKPLFFHKDGHCTITLLQAIVALGATSVEYIGEFKSYDEVEKDFA